MVTGNDFVVSASVVVPRRPIPFCLHAEPRDGLLAMMQLDCEILDMKLIHMELPKSTVHL